MTSKPAGSNPSQPSFDTLSDSKTSRLLQVGASGGGRPIDRLVEHVRSATVDDVLESLLSAGPMGEVGRPNELCVDGRATENLLRDFKKKSVQQLRRKPGLQSERIATATYLLSVGAAAVHHGTLLTSQPAEEVVSALLDLAAAAQEPWSEFLIRAAEELKAS